jgi:hypothetical protein
VTVSLLEALSLVSSSSKRFSFILEAHVEIFCRSKVCGVPEMLLRALLYFNNLFVIFDAHDGDKDHRLDEDEFIAAAAKMYHGKEVAQAAYAELATAHHSGHVLFYEFCDWCYSFHESLGLHSSTRSQPVSASAEFDARQAATQRLQALADQKVAHHPEQQGLAVGPLASHAMPEYLHTVSASGVQVDGERLPVGWDSPRMRRALAIVGVDPMKLLPKPEGWSQQKAHGRLRAGTCTRTKVSDGTAWVAEAYRQEHYDETQRLKLLARVVKCRHSIVAAGGKGLPVQPKTLQKSQLELQHHGVRDEQSLRPHGISSVRDIRSAQPSSLTRRKATTARPDWVVTPRATRTPQQVAEPRLSAIQLALKRKIDSRLKIAAPPSRNNCTTAGAARVGALDLGSCRIGDKGIRLLNAALRVRASTSQVGLPLTAIYLNGNGLTAKGVCELEILLGQKFAAPGLQVLNVNHNPALGDDGICKIINKLPATIQQLQLSGVGCGDVSMAALAARVASLPSLEQVSCGNNEAISERGWTGLAAGLRAKNSSFETSY